jgi:GT2 family glycosyltransferase
MNPALDFSVVIATHGRPEKLKRCLSGLAALDFPSDSFEVIVVDDGSPRAVNHALGSWQPGALRYSVLRQKNLGPGVARNTGARAATGRWLAFIDDDCIPDSQWLATLKSALEQHPDAMVGGGIVNGYPLSLHDNASWLLLDYLYEYCARTPGSPRFFATMNMALPRERFLQMDGFNETHSFLAEDRELCDRWVLHGGAFHYEPSARIHHYHGLTFRRFWRQHVKYGRGARRFHLARAARRSTRFRIEPLQFYLGLILHPLRKRPRPPRPIALSWCLVLSQVAMVAGYYADWWSD